MKKIIVVLVLMFCVGVAVGQDYNEPIELCDADEMLEVADSITSQLGLMLENLQMLPTSRSEATLSGGTARETDFQSAAFGVQLNWYLYAVVADLVFIEPDCAYEYVVLNKYRSFMRDVGKLFGEDDQEITSLTPEFFERREALMEKLDDLTEILLYGINPPSN